MHPENEKRSDPDWSFSRRVVRTDRIYDPKVPLYKTAWFWLVIVAPAVPMLISVIACMAGDKPPPVYGTAALFFGVWLNLLLGVLRIRSSPLERLDGMLSAFFISTEFGTDNTQYSGSRFEKPPTPISTDDVVAFVIDDQAKTTASVKGVDPRCVAYDRCPSDKMGSLPGLATLVTGVVRLPDGSGVVLTVAASAMPHELPRIAYLAGRSLGRLEGHAFEKAGRNVHGDGPKEGPQEGANEPFG